MLTSWKLEPYTVMRLTSGRRGDDVLKGAHLAGSSTIFPKQRACEQARNALNMTEKLPTT